MANYYHGVSTRQVDTSVSTPVEADSGIAFVVGAAPVHTVGGPVNDPVMCYTYQEAVSAFGFSDDWEKYPLCEMIYSQFQLYGVAPVVLVNVLDPEKHKKPVAEKNYPVTDGKVYLPLEAIQTKVGVHLAPVGGLQPDFRGVRVPRILIYRIQGNFLFLAERHRFVKQFPGPVLPACVKDDL